MIHVLYVYACMTLLHLQENWVLPTFQNVGKNLSRRIKCVGIKREEKSVGIGRSRRFYENVDKSIPFADVFILLLLALIFSRHFLHNVGKI